MKKGKEYEILIEKLYSKITPGCTIKRNDKIFGHDSKTEREIDLSIRQTIGPHNVLMIVQARDKNRKVDVNAIGELVTVVRDVRANKGIIISAKGFSKNALELANTHSIDALTAHDLDNRKWAIDLRMPIILNVYTGNVKPSFTLVAGDLYVQYSRKVTREGKIIPAPPMHLFQISKDNGKTFKTIQQTIYEIVSDIDDEALLDGKEHTAEYKNDAPEMVVWVAEGVTTPIVDFVFKFTVERKRYYKYFKVEEFRGLVDRTTNQITRVNVRVASEEFEVNNFDIITKNGLDLTTWNEYNDGIKLIHPYNISVTQVSMGFPKGPIKWKQGNVIPKNGEPLKFPIGVTCVYCSASITFQNPDDSIICPQCKKEVYFML